MKKLIHVVRGTPDRGVEFHLPDAPIRRHGQVIAPRNLLDPERSNYCKEGEFYLFDEGADAEIATQFLAQQNPGCEVRLLTVEMVAQAPAGAVVFKKITKDGVLPS